MRKTILEEHFATEKATAEAEQSEHRARIARLAELVRTRGYSIDVRKWVEDKLEEVEPRPGSEQDMLYLIGVRDGLKMVKTHLDGIELALKQELTRE